ncbi:MAG: hypothetical protein A2846_04080 [Candidatus Doudnabacteria bacterium RIFCSPHIGHO2_01_FULL_49_9]|uniref:Kazal-like domain-containing protein n=1 Tax=Candidatus Doudnabacteria bacterium RIFCSPHIGHO2_01_FULL_49_9 TaxID=1817827 RepID=A0A1F5P2M4_9BACT|nr:MAG: hypothetical protein A2846_04080 [Candidatus Doudnabacteria bacterium RIFCSPHIGHO2_01_FULL_49_9]
MSKEEVAVARKFIGKTGPGGCKGEACRTHCDDPANGEECLKFAEENGLIPKEEAERARKFMQVAKDGGPGGCQGRQCQEYCSSEEHQEECFSFAKKNGLVSKEEQEDFEVGQRLNQKLKEAGGPGGCKTDEECRVYCSDSAHVEECVAFAASQGGISEERAREMLKMFTEKRFEGGPGGGPSPEDLKRFQMDSEKRFDQFRQFEQQYRGGEGLPGQGDFPGGGMTGGQFPGGGMTGGNFPGGPGGCQSPAECMKYCSEHMDECMKFGQGGGEDASDFGGSDNQGSYQENDGFSGCITKGTKAVYVCAIGGKDAPSDVETTYFNGCHAESNGARVLHAGLCDGHTLKCSDIADPVCGTDNSTYTSACVAKDHGAEVQYEGACKFSNTRQPQPSRKPGPQPAQRQPYSDGGQMPQGKPEQYQQDQYPQGGCDEACQQKYREQYQQQGAQPSAGSTPSCSSGMFWDAGQKKCVSGSAQQGDSNQQNQQPSSTCDEACQQKYREQYQDSYQQPPEGQQYQSDGGQYQQGSYPTQQ